MPGNNHQPTSLDQPRCAVISISDARTDETDRPGALMQQRLEKAGFRIARRGVVEDDPPTVGRVLDALAEEQNVSAVLFNGSAGLRTEKRSFDAVTERMERRLPGFGEMFRQIAREEIGTGAMMLRGEAGLYRNMVVVALPGSVKAVKLAMDHLIAPHLRELVGQIRGQEASS
jgi:molybdenum cofactor biosynthesis protein B